MKRIKRDRIVRRRARIRRSRRKLKPQRIDWRLRGLPKVYQLFFQHAAPPPGVGTRSVEYGLALPVDLAIMAVYLLGFIHWPPIPWILMGWGALNIYFMMAMIGRLKTWFTGVINPFNSLPLNLLCFLSAVLHFGFIYFFLGLTGQHFNTAASTPFDAIYFSLITVATVGFGDIVPKTWLARLITISEIVFGLWFVLTVIPVAVAEQFEILRHKKESFIKFMDELYAATKRGEFVDVKPNQEPQKWGMIRWIVERRRKLKSFFEG